jgi:hypothetical protein
MRESNLGFYPFRAKWLLHEPPHSRNTHFVLLCSVRMSGETASVSLYSINYSVYITETERDYRAVRTESLNTIQVNFDLEMFTCISLFHRAFQFSKYNDPTNALVYNKTLI